MFWCFIHCCQNTLVSYPLMSWYFSLPTDASVLPTDANSMVMFYTRMPLVFHLWCHNTLVFHQLMPSYCGVLPTDAIIFWCFTHWCNNILVLPTDANILPLDAIVCWCFYTRMQLVFHPLMPYYFGVLPTDAIIFWCFTSWCHNIVVSHPLMP